jgi:hypothetical protein
MKKSGGIKRQWLKWLSHATLVFSLFAFSGHASEPKSFQSEPTRTELRQANRTDSRKTVCFKKHLANSNDFHFRFAEQKEDYTDFLVQYERQVEIRQKDNSISRVKKKQEVQFLIFYPTDNSEASGSDHLRG